MTDEPLIAILMSIKAISESSGFENLFNPAA
jgi:hypothetical protein